MNSRAKLEKAINLDNNQGSAVKTNVYQIQAPNGGFTAVATNLVSNQDLSVLRPTTNPSDWANNEGHSIFEMQPRNIAPKDLDIELI